LLRNSLLILYWFEFEGKGIWPLKAASGLGCVKTLHRKCRSVAILADCRHERPWATFGDMRSSTGCGRHVAVPQLTTSARRRHRNRLHSITSSARIRSEGGTVRPSAVAVLTLITNLNLLGSCTGSSSGLAPFKIRSTYTASWDSRCSSILYDIRLHWSENQTRDRSRRPCDPRQVK
jgi:hypothetical protein